MTPTASALEILKESFKDTPITCTFDEAKSAFIIQLPPVKEEVKEWPQIHSNYWMAMHGEATNKEIENHTDLFDLGQLLNLGLAFRKQSECNAWMNRQRAYVRLCKKRDELGGFVVDGRVAHYLPSMPVSCEAWNYVFSGAASEFAFHNAAACLSFIESMSADLTTYYAANPSAPCE